MAARKTLGSIPFEDYLRAWITANDCFMEDKSYISRCTVVVFENLVDKPDDTFLKILGVLGLDHPTPRVDIDTMANENYKMQWNKFVESGCIVKSSLPVLPNWARRYGYSLGLFN